VNHRGLDLSWLAANRAGSPAMFTDQERDRVREGLLELAESDPGVVAAAITGSYVAGESDDWSDIDLAFAIPGDLGHRSKPGPNSSTENSVRSSTGPPFCIERLQNLSLAGLARVGHRFHTHGGLPPARTEVAYGRRRGRGANAKRTTAPRRLGRARLAPRLACHAHASNAGNRGRPSG
jgi:hypothetical protein